MDFCSVNSYAINCKYLFNYEQVLGFRSFILYLISFIVFRIVAEQYNSKDPFNKGRLYNAAFKYVYDLYGSKNSLKSNEIFNFNCVVLHDVDLVKYFYYS